VDECFYCKRKFASLPDLIFELGDKEFDINIKMCEECMEKHLQKENQNSE
jgi:hypothetical protein